MALQTLKVVIEAGAGGNGGGTYFFSGTKGLYDGAIAGPTGISIAAGPDLDQPEYAVKELLRKGILRRVNAVTAVNGKRGRLKLLVAKDKLATALDALKDKGYSITGGSSGTITSVAFGTRVVSRG